MRITDPYSPTATNGQTGKRTLGFRLLDLLYLVGMILPLCGGILLRILYTPASEGISVSGALIYFTIPMPLQDLPVTESQVGSLIVVLLLLFLCLYLTHGIRAGVKTRRQLLAEWMVNAVNKMIRDSMGEYFSGFAPFIAAILGLSAFSSLLSLLGLYAPTSDVNIVGGWAILVFILITYYRMKCGPWQYVKSFGEPVKLLAPLNIISEVATPISMAFRHYGNVLSGSVIAVLLAVGLGGLSELLLGWLPGVFGNIPLLRIGIPAILSLYFDLFSGCLQAYIFAMLTMLYVSGAFPADEYARRREKKLAKRRAAEAQRAEYV